MTGWRWFLGGCLFIFVGLPLLAPLVESVAQTPIMGLVTTTLMLVAGVLGLAMPAGAFLAVVLT